MSQIKGYTVEEVAEHKEFFCQIIFELWMVYGWK